MREIQNETQCDWPFDDWLRAAVMRFGISPDQFWAMPTAEWLTLIRPLSQDRFKGSDLHALMQLYPDGAKNG